ncbi:protein XRI1-like [Musa acuminata AAA Group]|uniref:protein XRI1-like n=1 Tax=Musa acuminata AAA Group TaxID=214697 RepID=UPI0031D35430
MMSLDNSFLFPYQPSLDWDPHTFQLGDLHQQQHFMPLATESPVSSQASTGYLQDAVAEWGDQCKRRRVTSSPADDSTTTQELQDLLHEFWSSNCHGDPLHDLNYCMLQDDVVIPDETPNMILKTKAQVSALQLPQEPLSSSSSHQESHGKDLRQSSDAKPSLPTAKVTAPDLKERERRQCRKSKAKTSVAYPFAVVKPGGAEGHVTLDDINARLLRRPRRPVRHPVGEYAYGPCVSPDGLGLSGKAVASLTRIQTRGRGTITIIRTKG